MINNVLTKSPLLNLKECLAKEFSEYLDSPRVQQLMLLLDRLNEYTSFVMEHTIIEFNSEDDNEDLRLHIQCKIQQIDIDTGNFNKKLNKLRENLSLL